MNLINALNWRYAVKRMNGKKVPQEKVENILEATRLSASSMGLQPYTIIAVENPELRKRIQPAAYNQPQIIESSHLLVFAAWDDVTEEHIDNYISHIMQVRNVSAESLAGFKNSLLNITRQSKEQKHQWAARQTYIAFGTAIAAAALEQVDATPMEGFDSAALDEVLQLKELGLRSVTLLALGYRDEENDFLAHSKKVRREKDRLVLQVA
jgi:nitroreductase / dihydropteridine reductase